MGLILIFFLFVLLVSYEIFLCWVLLNLYGGFGFGFFWLETDGFEESLCGDNTQHGKRIGGAYDGVREESTSVSAGAFLDQRRGASDALEDQTDVGF